MSLSSYDSLLKQVESLKMENTHLRRELQDNSSHLTVLENEATSMKTVLTHLQTAMVEDLDSSNYQEPGDTSQETPGAGEHDANVSNISTGTLMAAEELDQNSNSSINLSTTEDDPATGQNWMLVETDNAQRCSSEPALGHHHHQQTMKDAEEQEMPSSCQSQKCLSSSPTCDSPSKKRLSERTGDWTLYSLIQELDQERNELLAQIEEEDKHRKWYYEQLEGLQHQLDNLPVSDTYNLQADMTRRQVEYEVQRLQDMMRETMGSAEQIAHRHEARLQRIHTIEGEMLGLQQRHREKLDKGKRDSGTCDHLERDQDGVVVTDASTNTTVSGQAFVSRLAPEDESHTKTDAGILVNGPNGTKLVTIATQTSEVYLPESPLPHEGGNRCHSNQNLAALYHGGWPLEGGSPSEGSLTAIVNQDTASVMSFNSSSASSGSRGGRGVATQQLGTKVEMVYSLLSMLGTHDKDDMSRTLLAMSSSPDSCIAMRQSGCLPLLIQLLHGSDKDSGLLGNTRGSKSARARAAAALHNIVHSHPDDKRGRREARVLRLLEQIRAHCDQLRDSSSEEEDDSGEEKKSLLGSRAADIDHHPGPAIAALMKLSFDEEHRHAICTLGGLQAIAELLQVDHDVNGNTEEQYNITMRRYACMALTNLTFGDGTNKALLCSMKTALRALVSQLQSPNEDLRQVAASVLRNLSWRADLASKKTLREVGSVTALMCAAMEVKKESTLKSILSALWNLSAHCSENKADICAVDGSLAFLVSTLTYKSPSKTLAIIENGGGILRNISSHIAVREDYRKVLRQQQCLQMLLKHLKSPSLTIVSNACGTLWNLSARCQEDQQALWEMGAVSMLRNLVNSKHKMISMGSAAALKNLLSARPALANLESDRYKPNKPGLHVRKQRALEAEIDQNLAETCDNMDSPHGSPTESRKHESRNRTKYVYSGDTGVVYPIVSDSDPRRCLLRGSYLTRAYNGDSPPDDKVHSPQRGVSRSGSQDSVGSAHSDISHDRNRTHHMLAKSNKLLQDRQTIFDRRRDPSIERVRPSATSSRIMQVMQEVALHAGLESGPVTLKDPLTLRESQSADSTPSTSRRGQNYPDRGRIPVLRSGIPTYNNASSGAVPLQTNTVSHSTDSPNYSQLGQRLENLHLTVPDPETEQDKPINYSMKYSETSIAEAQQTNPPVNHNQQTSAFVKPTTRVNNFVGALPYDGQAKVNNVPAHSTKMYSSQTSSKDNASGDAAFPEYTRAGDSDTEAVELPTNFSLRFADLDDESQSADEPINYSKHYKEEDGGLDPTLPSIHDDTVKTFCTEGTPLNFSTATSMNDLSLKPTTAQVAVGGQSTDLEACDETRNFAAKYSESEHLSGTGTQSTERNTGSTIVQKTPVTYHNNAAKSDGAAATVSKLSPSTDTSLVPSLYSYNDSTTSTSSPSEKPTRYCTEGTPTCFSRVSSLSSLHSTDSHSSHSKDDGLQSIDENDSLDTSQNVTLKAPPHDDSFQSANTSASHGESTGSGAAKSVTFDSNVQETPLMFSRCSSLGSLSSFDAHSVHSSVVSDYSRRASEVVSPSELPDSPSDTMPPSPSHRKSPVRFAVDDKKPATSAKAMPACPPDADTQTPPHQNTARLLEELPTNYADEGSPAGDFSCATSLSALTFDDEPCIKKEPEMRRIPLGQEDGSPKADTDTSLNMNDVTVIERQQQQQPPADDTPSFLDDADDNSSVSEGEENLLAECISLAMPTKSQKKMKKSTSDGHLKKKQGGSGGSSKPVSAIPTSHSAGLLTAHSPLIQAMNSPFQAQRSLAPPPQSQEDGLISGYDTPKRFNTEDTPLNYSATGSLSDLSMDSHTGDGAEHTEETPRSKPEPDDDGDLSGLLSDEDFDDEDLLSEAIQMAMPKKTTHKKPSVADRTAEGSEATTQRVQSQGAAFRPLAPQAAPSVPQQQVPQLRYPLPRSEHDVDGASEGHDSDCMKTYAVEGTPLNFSRATSLSDLTIDDMASEKGKETPQDSAEVTVLENHDVDIIPGLSDVAALTPIAGSSTQDSPMVFDVEGTPMSFSRNDSLSPLLCEEDPNLGSNPQRQGQDSPKHSKTPSKAASPRNKLFGGRKPGIQSPAITRLKTPGKHQHLPYEPSSHSTPMIKGQLGAASPRQSEDGIMSYAMEGTPMCFSQNSSLSSLDSDEHESMANRSGGSGSGGSEPGSATQPKDQSMTFKVEDTPANISGESSLSSLSVESLSFEPTAAETALLEECINAGMPKSSNKKKKEVKPSRQASGAEAAAAAKKKSPALQPDGNISSTKSKNEDRPQAEMAKAKPSLARNSCEGSRQDETAEVILLKEQKEACNQEMLQAKGLALAAAAAQVDAACASALATDPLTFSLTGSLEIDENKLAEEAEELSNKFAEMSMETSVECEEKDLCLEADKTDDDESEEKSKQDATKGEKTTKGGGASCQLFQGGAESTESENLGCRPLEQSGTDSDFSDIMKETLPEMSCSLVSNVTLTSLEEDDLEDDLEETTGNNVTVLQRENTVVEVFPYNSQTQDDVDVDQEDEEVDGLADDSLDTTLESAQDFSLEEEKALEENANLILSELSMTRAFSSGTLDDDLFIENETLSLVSNDYTSDTASEVSVTLSLSSHTASEQASEVSSSTLSHTSSTPTAVQPRGPRITKPTAKIVSKPAEKEEAPKGIRGGRKRAVPASVRAAQAAGMKTAVSPRPGSTTKSIRPGTGIQKKTTPVASLQKKVVTPPTKTGIAAGLKKTPPKTPPRAPVTTAKPATPPRGAIKSSLATAGKDQTASKPATPPRAATKASPATAAARNSATTRANQSTVQKANQAAASSPKSSPKPVRNTKFGASPQATASKSPASKTNSGIPRTGLSRPGISPRSSQEKPSKTETKMSLPTEQIGSKKSGIPASITAAAAAPRSLDRPAPPIKQGTFTMDSPTHQNAPTISQDKTDLNGNSRASGGAAEGQEVAKVTPVKTGSKSEIPTPSKVKVNATQQQKPVSMPNWSKTLEGRNFVVDTSRENGFQAPHEQIKVQKNSNSPPAALAGKRETEMKRSIPSSSSNQSLSRVNTSLNKTGSSSSLKSLNKTSSSSSLKSLNKTTSSSSLKSLGNQRTPPKVNPRTSSMNATSMKKSDSQTSLKKTGSRSSTPTGARSSPAGSTSSIPSNNSVSPPRKTFPTPNGKKPAVSKIAGLWRKDKKAETSGEPSEKTSNAGSNNAAAKSPKTARKSSLAKTKNDIKPVQKSVEEEEKPNETKEPIPRSSTYDKISVESGSGSSSGDTVCLDKNSSPQEEGKPPPVPPRSLWRRTYTVEQEEANKLSAKGDIPFEDNGKSPTASTDSQSTSDSKLDTSTTSIKETPQENGCVKKENSKKDKKRFSWWRKDSESSKEKKNKGGSKIPGPGSKKQDAKSPKGGVWVTIDGKISLQDPVESAGSSTKKTVANGLLRRGQTSVTVEEPVSAISEQNILQVRERVQQNSMAEKPSELNVEPMRVGPNPLTSPSRGPTPANAAIVPPFNYNPCQKTSGGTTTEEEQSSPIKPMTKTEMLIARRRQSYLNSLKTEDTNGGNTEDTKKSSCLVTTV